MEDVTGFMPTLYSFIDACSVGFDWYEAEDTLGNDAGASVDTDCTVPASPSALLLLLEFESLDWPRIIFQLFNVGEYDGFVGFGRQGGQCERL